MNDLIRDKIKKMFIFKILLKQIIYVINQKTGKFLISVSIFCLMFLSEIYMKDIYH